MLTGMSTVATLVPKDKVCPVCELKLISPGVRLASCEEHGLMRRTASGWEPVELEKCAEGGAKC